MHRDTIPHDELMQLPILQYVGPVHLVSTAHALNDALSEIKREKLVGFDTEKPPTFRKGQVHAPSLLQIATSRMVFIFQLSALPSCRQLSEIFENSGLTKAGVALSRDVVELRELFPFKSASMVDLGEIARRRGLKQTGLRNLAGIFLGGRITKAAQTSNWAAPKLLPKQIVYAATDAWICRELYFRFEALGFFNAVAAPA
jgi:ribonuclease D